MNARFASTRWSLVADASAGEPEAARAALDELCEAYWYPLYAFARRSGHGVEEAQDLTQGFFTALLEKGYLADADRTRGRFRTFLLAAFKHFVAKAHARARALKRGGGVVPLSLDVERGEARYVLEPADEASPERLYERRYALTLLDRAMARVAEAYRTGPPERAERFEALRPCLGGRGEAPYRVLANRLGLSETAVKVQVHRMRSRFRHALRAEIADTLGDPAEVDDEIRRLLQALGR